MRNPKSAKKEETTIQRAMAEPPPSPPPQGTPIVGVDAVAARMKKSRRTVIEWRQVYEDFPVHSDPFCVWQTTTEEVDDWMKRHPELYKSRDERKLENSRWIPQRRW